jgi:hypothetical protein
LTDSALDRELVSALGIEPSPEFVARVRMRVASESVVESGFGRIRRWSVEPLAAVAIAGIALTIVVPRLMRDGDAPTQARPKATLVRLKPATTATRVEAGLQAGLASRATSRLTRVPAEAPLRLSQPMFSEDERRALVRLVTAVEEGRVPPMPASTRASDQSSDTPDLLIAPLVIDPLPLLAKVEPEGEVKW